MSGTKLKSRNATVRKFTNDTNAIADRADDNALRVADEQHRVAQRIGSRDHDGEADRSEQVRGGEQEAVARSPRSRQRSDTP